MPENQNQPHLYLMKWLLKGLTIFLISLTLLAGSALAYSHRYRNNFFPGVKIAGQSASGQTQGAALDFWQNKIDQFQKNGLKYRYLEKEITLYPIMAATDPDATFRLIDFDVIGTVDAAYLIGRKHGYSSNFLNQLKALLFKINIPLKFNLNQESLINILDGTYNIYTRPSKNARPILGENGQWEILTEEAGTSFNYNEAFALTLERIGALSSEPIILKLAADNPTITKDKITSEKIAELEKIADIKNITIAYEDKHWEIPLDIYKNWLSFTNESGSPSREAGLIKISFNKEIALKYLVDNIAAEIYRPTLDAKFEIKNGKVAEFQGSQDGLALDEKQTLDILNRQIIVEGQEKIEAAILETKSRVSTGSLNELGISEIIGTGYSNFKGSPANRRHNINAGASSLNGILIKPGEIFSLVNALGEIDSFHGYLQELVIKGNKTIPEYGGGLCQIGTTIFRAALAAGLPILERRSHTYRVVYYEPAGKDATIYNPSPDFKFGNDTPYHILIQSRIQGDEIYFDFWSTKDGRIAEQTDSVIYNIKPAGETIYIESEDLKPGEKKCIESSHAGADAYFNYKITYPDGQIKEQKFSSHYIPWPAKCLIGKEPAPEITPTSTPIIME